MGRRALAGAAVVVLALAGCSDDGGGDTAVDRFVTLDGSPRHSDDAGVLTAIDSEFATLTLDGEHTYEIHPEVQSFSSIDGTTVAISGRLGQYVQVGLDGDVVEWIALVGSVLRLDGQPETVRYPGVVVATEDGGATLVLREGTVLAADPPFTALDADPVAAVLTIDVASDTVVDVAITG